MGWKVPEKTSDGNYTFTIYWPWEWPYTYSISGGRKEVENVGKCNHCGCESCVLYPVRITSISFGESKYKHYCEGCLKRMAENYKLIKGE